MSQGYTVPGGSGGLAGMGGLGDEAGGEESIIDRSSVFDGVLRTSRNLRIEGQAKGEIHCEGTLYVAEGAEVNARIVAANITAAGALSGEITCRGRLQILPTGRVSGRLATVRLVIQEGAIYEGELRMSNVGEEPAGDAGQAVTVTSGPSAGAAMAANQYRMAATTLAGRRSGQPSRPEDEQRAEPGPTGDPERGPDDNR